LRQHGRNSSEPASSEAGSLFYRKPLLVTAAQPVAVATARDEAAEDQGELENPKHPGLQTHEFSSIERPYEKSAKVFEAYVQNRTPGAYRLFWCYGPDKGEITIIAITAHPR
jgi:hypothetical protein